MNDRIKSEYENFKTSDKLSIVQNNYQLSYVRAGRFDISLSSYEAITYGALQDFFEKNISSIKPENFSSAESIEQEMKRFAYNLSSFKNAGLKQFKVIRKSI